MKRFWYSVSASDANVPSELRRCEAIGKVAAEYQSKRRREKRLDSEAYSIATAKLTVVKMAESGASAKLKKTKAEFTPQR